MSAGFEEDWDLRNPKARASGAGRVSRVLYERKTGGEVEVSSFLGGRPLIWRGFKEKPLNKTRILEAFWGGALLKR